MPRPVTAGDLKDLIEFVLLSIARSLEVLAITKLILMFLLWNLLINKQKLMNQMMMTMLCLQVVMR